MKCEVRWEIREKYHCVMGGARQFYCTTLHRRKVGDFYLTLSMPRITLFLLELLVNVFLPTIRFSLKIFKAKQKMYGKLSMKTEQGLKRKGLNLTNIYNVG